MHQSGRLDLVPVVDLTELHKLWCSLLHGGQEQNDTEHINTKTKTDPALRNSSLTMFFKGTQTRGGSFLNKRCEKCPDSWGTE